MFSTDQITTPFSLINSSVFTLSDNSGLNSPFFMMIAVNLFLFISVNLNGNERHILSVMH